jgi:hypothetical protein
MDLADLQRAAACIGRIMQAGRLDELAADLAAEQCVAPTLDVEMRHTTGNQNISVRELARALEKLLGVPAADAMEAAVAVVLDSKRARALEIIRRHDPERHGDEYGILDTYNKYGLDAMLDLGPVRQDEATQTCVPIDEGEPAPPPPIQIRFAPDTMEGASP